jgi:hypothetical protein
MICTLLPQKATISSHTGDSNLLQQNTPALFLWNTVARTGRMSWQKFADGQITEEEVLSTCECFKMDLHVKNGKGNELGRYSWTNPQKNLQEGTYNNKYKLFLLENIGLTFRCSAVLHAIFLTPFGQFLISTEENSTNIILAKISSIVIEVELFF